MVDGVQAKRVQPGRDVALGSHGGGRESRSTEEVTNGSGKSRLKYRDGLRGQR